MKIWGGQTRKADHNEHIQAATKPPQGGQKQSHHDTGKTQKTIVTHARMGIRVHALVFSEFLSKGLHITFAFTKE